MAKEHFNPLSKQEEKVKILSIASKDSVTFQRKKREKETKTFILKTGDSLALVSGAFEGITITAITANTVEFSNGVIKTSGEEMDVDVYMSSYQEQMLRLALERHFETERENFCNRTFKIKTLALFFIDDISSYRPNDEGKNPYLLTTFERLLKEQIELPFPCSQSMIRGTVRIWKLRLLIFPPAMRAILHRTIVILMRKLPKR